MRGSSTAVNRRLLWWRSCR